MNSIRRMALLGFCGLLVMGCAHKPEHRAVLLKIEKCSTTPLQARRGNAVRISTDYLVKLPQGVSEINVDESWTLKKGNTVLAMIPPQRVSRGEGAWQTNASIVIPKGAKPGTYVVEHRVQAGAQVDAAESAFTVVSR